jgi:hypothetical protein
MTRISTIKYAMLLLAIVGMVAGGLDRSLYGDARISRRLSPFGVDGAP